MRSFKHQAISGVATLAVFALGIGALTLFTGGFSAVAALTSNPDGNDVHGLISLSALAVIIVVAFQQTLLRVVIFRK
jgi:hypothetical protein